MPAPVTLLRTVLGALKTVGRPRSKSEIAEWKAESRLKVDLPFIFASYGYLMSHRLTGALAISRYLQLSQ